MDELIKTTWNLDHLYIDQDDPQIKKDIVKYMKDCRTFAEKHKTYDYLKNAEELYKALEEYSNLIDSLNDGRPLIYFHLRTGLNGKDEFSQGQLNIISDQLTKAENLVLFFSLKLGKISQKKQKEFLNDPKLTKYKYYLERTFLTAKYELNEDQEKIINLYSLPGYSLWAKGMDKALSQKTVKFKDNNIPLPEASSILNTLHTKDRRILFKEMMKVTGDLSDFAESEINAVVTYKKIGDELRGFKAPYESRIIQAENDINTVLTLVETITSEFKVSQDFYKLKAKLLEEKFLKYADRTAEIGTFNVDYSFTDVYKRLQLSLLSASPIFAQVLDNMIIKGQIDVYPKKGKDSGAYCLGSHNNPTYILLNFKDNFQSATTLAHEVGHAIHTFLSKKQPVIYESYSLSMAETASTFFETLFFNDLTTDLPEDQKVIAIHNKLQDAVSSIFRQIACFNFESELHQTIRTKGSIPHKEIVRLHNKHMLDYLGDSFKLDELDGNFYITWGHLRSPFYVYTYALGQIASYSLLEMYYKDKRFIKEIIKLFESGGKDTPENLFKGIGIDISSKDFYINGINNIKKDIQLLEKLTKNK
jgi:oligoendopeptidase F